MALVGGYAGVDGRGNEGDRFGRWDEKGLGAGPPFGLGHFPIVVLPCVTLRILVE